MQNDATVDPLEVLGGLIENYMDAALDANSTHETGLLDDRKKRSLALATTELRYFKGGRIVAALTSPSRSFDDYIRDQKFV